MCLLDNEERCIASTMRPTGDYGNYRHSDGRLCYIGRVDKQIKRLGHRINLDHIQQVSKLQLELAIHIKRDYRYILPFMDNH